MYFASKTGNSIILLMVGVLSKKKLKKIGLEKGKKLRKMLTSALKRPS